MDIEAFARFAKKAQYDRAGFHRVNKLLSDACDAVTSDFALCIPDYHFVVQAMSSWSKRLYKFKVLSMEEGTISDMMQYSLTYGHSLSWIISYVEMKGLSSKVVF